MKIEPLALEHFDALELQDAQRHFHAFMGEPLYKRAMIEAGPAYAGICEGRVVGVAGLAKMWQGRAIAWSLLAADIGHHFIEVHRAVERALAFNDIRRVEAHVDPTYASAVRWIQLLGFTRECTMRAFTPDGRDADLYVRIR